MGVIPTWTGLAAPVGAAAAGWFYLNVLRNYVTYEAIHVQFGGDHGRYKPIDNPIGLITFERIILENKSIKPLHDVRVPLDHVSDVLFGQLRGSSIGAIDEPAGSDSKTLTIFLREMPARERITISFLHRGTGHLGGRILSSGGNKYRIIPHQEYRQIVVRFQIAFLVLMIFAVNVWV